MKEYQHKTRKQKKLMFLGLALLLSPIATKAANQSLLGGISDGTLLILLLAIVILLLFVINGLAQSIISVNKAYKPKKKKDAAKTLLLLVLGGASLTANANNGSSWPEFIMSESLFWTFCSIIILLAAIIAYLFKTLKTMIRLQSGESFEEKDDSILSALNASLTDNVPIEEESNVMLDHEYDGIRELDNNLPPWWKYMFYATIIFAIVYLIRFHITGSGKLSHEEYQAEMEQAALAKEEALADAGDQVNEDNVSLLIDEASLAKGAAIFKGNCATCHMESGAGGAGPNLTDEYWIHGGGIKNVFSTIKYGVPAKGMIAWQSQFNPTQMQQVASYVLSLQGTNPANAIAPQGELWVPEADENTAEENLPDSTLSEIKQ